MKSEFTPREGGIGAQVTETCQVERVHTPVTFRPDLLYLWKVEFECDLSCRRSDLNLCLAEFPVEFHPI